MDKNYKIQQIYKLDTTGNNLDKVKVYPVTSIQSVFDICSGNRLDTIMYRNNHIFLHGKHSLTDAINSVELNFRRKGLFITYIGNDGEIYTKYYSGESISDEQWNSPLNWNDISKPQLDPSTLNRITIIETELEKIKNKPNSSSDSSYDDTDIKNSISAIQSEVDKLKNKPDSDTIFDPSAINNRISQIENRIIALESKTDNDTIYDDTTLSNKINDLTSEIEKLKKELAKKPNTDTNKHVTSGKYIPAEKVIRLTFNDSTTIDIPFDGVAPEETPKKKVYFGYKETTQVGDYATKENLNKSLEFDESPITLHFGESKDNIYGYWGVAIDKELLPNGVSRVEMEAIGQFMLYEDDYNVNEIEIDGKQYYFIQDTSIEEINPVGLRIQ